MVILIDNSSSDVENELIISDDGTGQDIMIPTVMINKANGTALLDYMLTHPE